LVQQFKKLLPGSGRARRVREASDTIGCDMAKSLYLASDAGNLSRAEALIRRGCRTDHRTPGGWTPVLRAAFHGDLAMIKLLLRAGADANQAGNSGFTALELSVLGGHVTLLAPLLAAKADPAVHDHAAVRRALEKKNLDAMVALGPDVIFQVYEKDQKQIHNMAQECGLTSSDVTISAREKARKKTLEGILDGNSDDFEEGCFTCVVCFEAPRSVVLQPCLHLVLCSGCAPKFKNCPMCRRDVRSHISAYLS
jgi:hypothetical protein